MLLQTTRTRTNTHTHTHGGKRHTTQQGGTKSLTRSTAFDSRARADSSKPTTAARLRTRHCGICDAFLLVVSTALLMGCFRAGENGEEEEEEEVGRSEKCFLNLSQRWLVLPKKR